MECSVVPGKLSMKILIKREKENTYPLTFNAIKSRVARGQA